LTNGTTIEDGDRIQAKVAADPDTTRAKAFRRTVLGDDLYTVCDEFWRTLGKVRITTK